MFLAKAAQHSFHTFLEPAYRTHRQNQKTESHPHQHAIHKNGDKQHYDYNPDLPHTAAEFEELEQEEENAVVKMSRNSGNAKRQKNHAGHKASKHRKNNKGNKAGNSNGSHNNKHRGRNDGRAIRGTGEGWYAVAAMQGRRPHMEDTYHVLVPGAASPAGGDLHSLFGVFDGHGGKKVSHFLKENLLPAIVEAYVREKEADGNDPNEQRTPTDRLQAILPRTFLEIDEQCMADDRLSGSTAVVAILTETDIVVANVGDSRGVIYRSNEVARAASSNDAEFSDASLDSAPSEDDATEDVTDDSLTDDDENDTDTDTDEELADDRDVKGKAKKHQSQQQQQTEQNGAKQATTKKEKKKKRRNPKKKPEEGSVGELGRWQSLSVDHKPNRPDERERVESAGGRVTKRPNDVWRFQNVLAVSRAFGDHGLKVGPGGAGLTANPEIKVFPRQENDKFFVLASDGLWDVYTNEQAARVGRNVLLRNPKNPAQEVANALANGAYKKESLDNITALVVLLDEAATDSSTSSSSSSPVLDSRSRHSEL